MMTVRRLALPSVLLAALALGGCAGSRHEAATPVTAAVPGKAPGAGMYKVGTPYQIDGTWYYPSEDFNYDETGIASWYGEAFHGKFTANGEVFDLNTITAAHRTLPLPTVVQVTNLDNGRTIQVRINDRGPFARGRILDLSRRSAQLLGFEGRGTAKVRVKILVPESIQAAALARQGGGEEAVAGAVIPAPKAAPVERVAAASLAPPPGARQAPAPSSASLPVPVPAPSLVPRPVSMALAAPTAAPVALMPVKPTQIYIQAGAYSQAANATKAKDRISNLGAVQVSGARVQGVDVYRVRLGPIANVDDADRILDRVVHSGMPEARIVVD